MLEDSSGLSIRLAIFHSPEGSKV